MKISDNLKIVILFILCFSLALYSALTGQLPQNIGRGKTSGDVLGTQTPATFSFPNFLPW